jgi:predicted amidohydrolase
VPQPSLRVAAVQAESAAGDVAANVSTATTWVRRVASDGARVVVFPELFLTGYDRPAWSRDDAFVRASDDRLAPLATAARETDTVVLAGAAVQDPGTARRSIGLLAFQPDGQVVLAYEKQHLWDAEREFFAAGTSGSSLDIDGWRLGLAICYDGCFPEHARAACDAGALAYVCPSAYVLGGEHRRDLYYAARALDNGCYSVMAGLVGRCGETQFSGGTAIYDPQGRAVSWVDEGEDAVVADLELAAVEEAHRINPLGRDRLTILGDRTTIAVPAASRTTSAR